MHIHISNTAIKGSLKGFLIAVNRLLLQCMHQSWHTEMAQQQQITLFPSRHISLVGFHTPLKEGGFSSFELNPFHLAFHCCCWLVSLAAPAPLSGLSVLGDLLVQPQFAQAKARDGLNTCCWSTTGWINTGSYWAAYWKVPEQYS